MKFGKGPFYRLPLVATVAAILGCGTLPVEAAWERAHADGGNTGFADVVTIPAGRGSVSVPNLGSIAPGAGPVIAKDGMVYIGNEQGRLFAIHPDGKPAWSRDLPSGQAILASPAIGSDGSIYVIGVMTFRDHRVTPVVTRHESTLHKFLVGGGWSWQKPFPSRFVGGITSAPPNIMRSGNAEVIVAPVAYPSGRGDGVFDLDLVAFSTDGAVLASTVVLRFTWDVTGGGGIMDIVGDILTWLPGKLAAGGHGFAGPGGSPSPEALLPANVSLPLPGVATIDGTPWAIVSDGVHSIVGYHFLPGTGFVERFRRQEKGAMMRSAPVVLPDGHTATSAIYARGKLGAVLFAGPNAGKLANVTGLKPVDAAPTRTVDRLVVVVQRDLALAVLREGKLVSSVGLPGQSVASAAASRTHVFVSTVNAFVTFDAAAQVALATFHWVGGGLWPPAIGPQGHVYAMASNVLFVFPPPPPRPVEPIPPPR
jgi:hypothetical protein